MIPEELPVVPSSSDRWSVADVIDATLSAPLYVLWIIGGIVTGGWLWRATARRLMDPPGMKYGRGR